MPIIRPRLWAALPTLPVTDRADSCRYATHAVVWCPCVPRSHFGVGASTFLLARNDDEKTFCWAYGLIMDVEPKGELTERRLRSLLRLTLKRLDTQAGSWSYVAV